VSTYRRTATALVTALVLLAGCGSGGDVRDFIEDRYQLTDADTDGDVAVYNSPDPVGTTTAAIADAVPPAERQADGGNEYLRYSDDIVIVSAAANGSTVLVEDLDRRYRSGFFVFLGTGFRPGSPAGAGGDGGPGDGK
jgi:SAM-dependent methyltransferase